MRYVSHYDYFSHLLQGVQMSVLTKAPTVKIALLQID